MPGVLLALGDCQAALTYILKVGDRFRDRSGDSKAFTFTSLTTGFRWHKALAEFCLVSRKGGKPTMNRMKDFDVGSSKEACSRLHHGHFGFSIALLFEQCDAHCLS